MPWYQAYDPLGHWLPSALLAALPVFVLLGSLAFLKVRAHKAALAGLAAALAAAVAGFGMPVGKAGAAAVFGAAYGLFPIGWIILNVIFLYTLVEDRGHFATIRAGLERVTRDRRLQLLLIAFSFGAFFEGAAGFGTPVAVSAAMLIGLGFRPLAASGLSLIANTSPVAFGALGTPIIALAGVTGLDIRALSAMVGRQLPFFSVLIPFWLVWAYAGFRGMIGVWPALAAAGVSFAVPQFLISNFHGPWLADIGPALISIAGLVGFLRFWSPRSIWTGDGEAALPSAPRPARAQARRAWAPWFILSLIVFAWGVPAVKRFLDGIFSLGIAVPGLDRLVLRVPPVVAAATPEPAVFTLNALSATGTGIFVAALIAAAVMGYKPRDAFRAWLLTLKRIRLSLLTVSAMMAIGFVSRYGGLDAAMGLLFARTGVLYPFFGAMLGWLGVALTGSDTSSNVLFGSLQTITARRLGLDPVLMAAANSSGGVMGKMIDAQSIVVAGTATRWTGHEGEILRYVFFHSLALATLMGILVTLQAYVF